MKKEKITNRIIILIIITVSFYAVILSFADFNLLIEGISNFNFQYMPLILSLTVAHFVILGIKFHILTKKLGIVLPLKENLKIFIAGLSLAFTPVGIGTAIKSQLLKNKLGKSISSTLPIIIIERWTELLAVLILSSILLIWSDTSQTKIVLGFGYLLLAISFLIIYNSKIFNTTKQILSKIKFVNKFTTSLDESRDSLSILNTKKTLVEATSLSIVAKFIQVITVYFIFLSYGVDLGLFLSGQIYYTSMILGVITFIPAGILVTEASMLSMLVDHNVQFAIATLIVILTRIITLWLATFVGIFMLKFGFRHEN